MAGDGLYSGQFGRRDGIRQARNRAGRPAVCRRSTWNGASRRHPYICSSQRPCQPTLWCAVCLLLCRRRRLPRRLTRLRSCRQRWLRRERRAVCACVRCLRFLACAVASNAHWRRQAFRRTFWHVCCCCVCAGYVLGVRASSEAAGKYGRGAGKEWLVLSRSGCARKRVGVSNGVSQ